MRIISGKYKGRKIQPPKNLPVRPTTDFAKEAIFNVLENNFELGECRVLDLFCGTGSISYEFASRGATAVAVDQNSRNIDFIRKTINDLNIDSIKVIKADVFRYLARCTDQFNIIFADPPYELEKTDLLPGIIFERNLLSEEGWLIVEHSKRTDLSGKAHFVEQRTYGNVNFSIFSKVAKA